MGKRRRSIAAALLLSMGICGIAAQKTEASAAETSAGVQQTAEILGEQNGKIGQVYANLPEVVVYGTGLSEEAVRQGEAFLSQERLELADVMPFSESGDGICYYVLLDVSGSIPNAYFRAIKEGIQNLQNQLKAKDRLVLCTFGEEVILAADGSQTSEQLSAVLEGLTNKDQKTLLFEGISRAALLAEQARNDGTRKVLVVISDGEDIAVGRKMAQEAQDVLKEKGLPVYAFCIRDTSSGNINTFGEFARVSGGEIRTFRPEEGSEVLCDLADSLAEELQIRYQAPSNLVSNKEEQFHLKLADGSDLSRAVMNNQWIPDTKAPSLLSLETAGSSHIRLVFDEPLQGAETAANYQLTLNGEAVGITAVSYETGEHPVVSLTLAEPVKNGTYVLNCTGITDVSMEKNQLSGSMRLVVDDVVEAAEETETEEKEAAQTDYTGVLFLIFAGVVALVIVIVVKSSAKKKKSKDEPEDQPASESKIVMADGGFRQHVATGVSSAKSLEVWISRKGKASARTEWKLGSSLIVGRASICDICVDDSEMSRQHFCLEQQNGSIYISDLGSTNGTSVNGIRIHEKRKLESGAVVEAGTMKFVIRW